MLLDLKQAVKDFRGSGSFIAQAIIGLIVAAALITMGSIWLETEKVDQLLDQKTKLTAEVSALQEQAEQARRNNGRKPGK